MVRISDARMSGTSYGACVLHVAPESHIGGPLALGHDGDLIELDVAARKLEAARLRRGTGQAPRRLATTPTQIRQRLRRALPETHHTHITPKPTKAETSTSSKPAPPPPNPKSTELVAATMLVGGECRPAGSGRTEEICLALAAFDLAVAADRSWCSGRPWP
jgi:hypothetical protein